MSIEVVQCFKCKVFTALVGAFFKDGHVYCSDDRPEGAIEVKKNMIYAEMYGGILIEKDEPEP